MKRCKHLYLIVCVTGFLLPLGLRFGVPFALAQVDRAGWLTSPSTDTVKAIEDNALILVTPQQTTQRVTLTGLASVDPKWQRETRGVLTVLLQASHHQVNLTEVEGKTLVSLPNGTLIQQVLLQSGVAKLDEAQLSDLPPSVAIALQQAQREAQARQQNLWGDAASYP